MSIPNSPTPSQPSSEAIRLRPVKPADLDAMFEMQSDPQSNDMAGTKPRTREVFFAVWAQIFPNTAINSRIIELGSGADAQVVGSISCFQADGNNCIGYWISKQRWGKGIASRALQMFLTEELRRPLHATAATSNVPSHRILEKAGFRRVGTRMGEETDRFIPREIADFVLE